MKIKRANNFISVKTKLIMAFMITIIPVILLGVISYNTSGKAIKSLAADSTIQTMEQTNKYMELLLTDIENTTFQLLIRLDSIESLLSNIKLGGRGEIHLVSPDDRDISAINGKLQDISNSHGFIDQSFFKKINTAWGNRVQPARVVA